MRTRSDSSPAVQFIAPFVLTASLLALPACSRETPPATASTDAGAVVPVRFAISGMYCEGCVAAVEMTMDGMDGVESCEVSLADGMATMQIADRSLIPAIEAELTNLQYTVREIEIDTVPHVALADESAPFGVLNYSIVDDTGAAIPARLTFMRDGEIVDLFPEVNADPKQLAVRKNVVYTKTGHGRCSVPVGTYEVIASRGLEYAIARATVEITEGGTATFDATLAHEVPTPGWIGGDFHLHTLTNSGHGDSNLPERIISLVGEGVEVAIATDHNFHTDLDPLILELGVFESIAAITGNELTTGIGHFNVFPVEKASVLEHRLPEGGALFGAARDHDHPMDPIIQVNHPRWDGMDFFRIAKLDPVTGQSTSSVWSSDFDAIEVLNENVGWGYHNADTDPDLGSDNVRHSVLRDWFNLLNQGHRMVATGNSDSHHVREILAGWPRNLVRVDDDTPNMLDHAAFIEAVRAGHVVVSCGPVLDVTVNGAGPGDLATSDGQVTLNIKLRAASWIDTDRVRVIVNGDEVHRTELSDDRTPQRLDETIQLVVAHDSWLVVIAEGDEPLSPVVHASTREARPLGFTNPIWIDADGDGAVTAPMDQARQAVIAHPGNAFAMLDAVGSAPTALGLLTLAAHDDDGAADTLIGLALAHEDRNVRLHGARAAEWRGGPTHHEALQSVIDDPSTDPYLGLACLRAMSGQAPLDLSTYLDRFDADALGRYSDELADRLRGNPILAWEVVGYFEADQDGPITNADGPYAARDDSQAAWSQRSARADGYLSLLQLSVRPEHSEQARSFARTWIRTDTARTVWCALGSDDGVRVWLNEELIHEEQVERAPSPLQHVQQLELQAGWNRLLVEVTNGSGNTGLYFQLFDDDVSYATSRD